ncbi:MAG: phosphatidylcholine/phosphatidylserine synthase [Proteobacteria bacterium]|nr:phosphatidylcholine/phosphatidylserine synthase [Pseudomonadota bacterium]
MDDQAPRGAAAALKGRLHGHSLKSILPNLATVMAMCVGLSAIRFALQGRFDLAVGAICIAGILDAMDGRLARLLGAASEFGAELDSLSDFVCFGVAPGVVLYILCLNAWNGFGWAASLFFAVCMGLRLARFNISSRLPDRPLWSNQFFTGVPAPAGALLAIFPLTLYLAFDVEGFIYPGVCVISLVGAGTLMVSRLPTFSFKSASIPRPFILPLLMGVGLAVVALLSAPWPTLSVITLAYIAILPLGPRFFRKHVSSSQEQETHEAH